MSNLRSSDYQIPGESGRVSPEMPDLRSSDCRKTEIVHSEMSDLRSSYHQKSGRSERVHSEMSDLRSSDHQIPVGSGQVASHKVSETRGRSHIAQQHHFQYPSKVRRGAGMGYCNGTPYIYDDYSWFSLLCVVKCIIQCFMCISKGCSSRFTMRLVFLLFCFSRMC